MEAIAVVCIHRLKLCFSHLLCWPGSIQNAFRGPLAKQGPRVMLGSLLLPRYQGGFAGIQGAPEPYPE